MDVADGLAKLRREEIRRLDCAIVFCASKSSDPVTHPVLQRLWTTVSSRWLPRQLGCLSQLKQTVDPVRRKDRVVESSLVPRAGVCRNGPNWARKLVSIVLLQQRMCCPVSVVGLVTLKACPLQFVRRVSANMASQCAHRVGNVIGQVCVFAARMEPLEVNHHVDVSATLATRHI